MDKEKAAVREKLLQLISKKIDFPANYLSMQDCLQDDLDVDSLGKLRLILGIEDVFGIRLDACEIDNNISIDALYQIICKELKL